MANKRHLRNAGIAFMILVVVLSAHMMLNLALELPVVLDRAQTENDQ